MNSSMSEKFGGNTPISFLSEMCISRHVKLPRFEEKPVAGSGFGFEFTATVEGYMAAGEIHSASGMASTKREAKHLAAANVLKLLGYKPDDLSRSLIDDDMDIEQTIASSSPLLNNTLDGTNIQKLEFHCAERALRSPVYENFKNEGPSHDPRFHFRCRVWKQDGTEIVMEDFANSKKKSKIKVAMKMLQHLQGNFRDSESPTERMSGMSASASYRSEAKSVAEVLHQYRCMKGPLITNLRDYMVNSPLSDSENLEEVLQLMGGEENFKVSYKTGNWDQTSSKSQCYCCIQFCADPSQNSLEPPCSAVFVSEGDSEENARQRAAGEALTFLVTVSQ